MPAASTTTFLFIPQSIQHLCHLPDLDVAQTPEKTATSMQNRVSTTTTTTSFQTQASDVHILSRQLEITKRRPLHPQK
jgi:hypothetical protein